MAQKQPNEPDRGAPLPGVIPGDEVYVRGKAGPVAGSVVCHGKHGATIKIGEAQHRVPWRHVLGHKRRASLTYQIDEEGEDGMLVRDPQGRRHYVAIPPEAREEKMVIKSLTGGSRLVVLAKAIAPRAGLTEKQVTDKNGVQTTRWVRNTPDMPAPELGHHVGFQNGEHAGHGHVMASGADGVTVQDGKGGVHRVPHANITHRWEGPGRPTASPHAAEKPQQAADKPPNGLAARLAWERSRREQNSTGTKPVAAPSAPKAPDTPEFRRWFGNSKVVDANGKPLVVYHGTGGDFERFAHGEFKATDDTETPGWHFSASQKVASDYAREAHEKARHLAEVAVERMNGGLGPLDGDESEVEALSPKSGANVMPVMLRIERPLIIRNLAEKERLLDKDERWRKDFIHRAKRLNKYDGIILEPSVGDSGEREYIVFSPEQIKSAIGNSGAFDPDSPNITKALVVVFRD